ncbi:MAG: hypothetical protein QW670_06290 [Candidatus Bathyarchaeia archaeon]
MKNYLKTTRQSPKRRDQHIPHLLVYKIGVLEGKQRFTVADFDDGLIHVGTRYCFNTQIRTVKIALLRTYVGGIMKN